MECSHLLIHVFRVLTKKIVVVFEVTVLFLVPFIITVIVRAAVAFVVIFIV